MDNAALLARIAELEAEVTKAKAKAKPKFKVTDKGGISLYGVGRFPATFYASQWDFIIDAVPELKKFMQENKDRLATKE